MRGLTVVMMLLPVLGTPLPTQEPVPRSTPALAGAVAVTAIWLGDQDLDMSVGEKFAVGIPVGALAGGAVGALIGAFFPRWRPVQP